MGGMDHRTPRKFGQTIGALLGALNSGGVSAVVSYYFPSAARVGTICIERTTDGWSAGSEEVNAGLNGLALTVTNRHQPPQTVTTGVEMRPDSSEVRPEGSNL